MGVLASMIDYFSDRERGPKPRTVESISPVVWGGIIALVQPLVSTGAFAAMFPVICPDGAGTTGTDENAFALAIRAEMPELAWPLETTVRVQVGLFAEEKPFAPDTLLVLDFIEFCYRSIAKPIQGPYHDFFRHNHLRFDPGVGKAEFREDVNRIFGRNGIAFELDPNGRIVRLAPPVLGSSLSAALFRTGDATLDGMFEESRSKFLSPDPKIRREALERLWDCWERLKSLEDPENKKQSVETLFGKCAKDAAFRKLLDDEARALTNIGNSFHIRHSEVTQATISDSAHVDYLFHRLFGMMQLLLGKRA